MRDDELRALEYAGRTDPLARYRWRLALVRAGRGEEAGLEAGDFVEVTNTRDDGCACAWSGADYIWRGRVLSLHPEGLPVPERAGPSTRRVNPRVRGYYRRVFDSGNEGVVDTVWHDHDRVRLLEPSVPGDPVPTPLEESVP